jgi:carbamoyltransferase
MHLLGIAGLADIESFLEFHYPAQMSGKSRIVQGMDAAAALISDGRVIAAVSEERFDRRKKSGRFPYQAIDYCLQAGGLTMADIDEVCGNFNYNRYRHGYRSDPAATLYFNECLSADAIRQKLDRYGSVPKFTPYDHHATHLHSALASAPFTDCLAIVMDAAGEIGATTIYNVTNGKIERLRRYSIIQSLGMFYSLITQFLGFAFNEDEYKVMGLAALGNPQRYESFFENAILLKEGGVIEIPILRRNGGFAEGLFFQSSSRAIEAGLGFNGIECGMDQRADVSAALQQRFTQALFHIIRHHRKDHINLLMSGGCAENCSAMGEVRSSELFHNIHVSYASGDEGTALGAAAAASYEMGQPLRIPSQMPFFGPEPSTEVVRRLAPKFGLRIIEYASDDYMLDAAAEDIALNRIVGLCHGRMEYGARALGNRSLLANPTYADNKERINQAIKKRENFRPFAPAVLAEDAYLYFDLRKGEVYPYMTMLTTMDDASKPKLPAVVHIDGTARVQTVDRHHNPALYHLLQRVKTLTGFGIVLNTSYNVNHQPIVCSEQEAMETYLEMGIDALYMARTRLSR